MNNKKATKRALLTSVMALVMCVVMLVGTTFAWFTDTASTGVNKIQAGNLDIELQMKDNSGNWVNAEGKTLPFLVEGQIPAEGTQILWEPGCTYYVPAVRVVNKGNLAVKFEYVVEALGVTGKLADVLDPVFKIFDADGKMIDIPDDTVDPLGELDILKPGEASPAWSFGYHMLETAGNEYQNATATGMCLTVVATQATYEKDSISDQYDKDATYPVVEAADLAGKLNELADGSVITVTGTVDTALTISKPVTIHNLTATAPVTIASNGVTLNAANIEYKAAKTPALVVNSGVTDVTITNSTITAATGRTGSHTAVSLPVSGKVVFTGNTVTNDYNGVEFGQGATEALGDGSVIANNVFKNIGNNAISIYRVANAATVTIENNTFDKVSNAIRLSNYPTSMTATFKIIGNTVDTANSWENVFVLLEDTGNNDFTKYNLNFSGNTFNSDIVNYFKVYEDSSMGFVTGNNPNATGIN